MQNLAKSRKNGEKINFSQLFAGALSFEDKYGLPTRDLKLKYLSNNDENNSSVKINLIDAKNISQVSQCGESSESDEEQQLLQVNKLKYISLSDKETAKQDSSSNSSFDICIPDDIKLNSSDEFVSFNNSKVMNYNTNAEFLHRQDRRRSRQSDDYYSDRRGSRSRH